MNANLVSNADKYYFGNATVKGLREQLKENNLPTSGLKYELYLRLVDNGIRLYNDDRSDDISDSDEDIEDPNINDAAPVQGDDSEIDESEEEYFEDDDSESEPEDEYEDDDDEENDQEQDDQDQDDQEQDDQDQDDQDQDDQDQDGSEQDDSEQDDQGPDNQDQDEQDQDDQGQDEQDPDDQGQDEQGQDEQDQDDQGQDDQGSSGKKRRRNDDDDGDDSGDDGNAPARPARRRRRIALPPELQVVIVENLNAPGVWNLIDTAPEEYLTGDMNALILEARYQYRLDYPPPAAAGDPDPWPDRPLSLLEWVAARAVSDASFRRTNRTRVMRVIDAYLAVYGMADPAPLPEDAEPNPREDLLYYFRDRTDVLASNSTPLMEAAEYQGPAAVQLLLMRGANVNQVMGGTTALERAIVTGGVGFEPGDPVYLNDTYRTAYVLIEAGADVALLTADATREAQGALDHLVGDQYQFEPGEYPRIDNILGLSVRRFIGDERSDPNDRMILTVFVIAHGTMEYPRFV